MSISLNDTFTEPLNNIASHTIMAGGMMFVFNDGDGRSQADSTFSVYDDSGNLLIAEQQLTDATDEELAGWDYFGYNLPYYSVADRVVVHADGSFTICYSGQNPIVQRDTGANPDFTEYRTFSASGTGGASQVGGYVAGPNDQVGVEGARFSLSSGYLAEAQPGGSIMSSTITLSITDGVNVINSVTFENTGEPLYGFDAGVGSTSVVEVDGVLLLFYQDVTSGDVFLRRFDAATLAQIGDEQVIGGTENATIPRAAADVISTTVLSDGRIVLLYSNQTATDTDLELYQAILNSDGSYDLAPTRVSTDFTDGAQYGGMAWTLSDGGYAIIYHRLGGVPYRQDALIRQYNADGTPVEGTYAFGEEVPNSLNAHQGVVFENGFGYMIDGFGTAYTIQVSGQTGIVPPPAGEPTAGADNLAGTENPDVIDLLAGDDTYAGGAGSDHVTGGEGNDSLMGEGGNDTILGGAGDDFLFGGIDDDVLDGGAGADAFDGGSGNDTVSYESATRSVRIDLQNDALMYGDAIGDTYVNIEVFQTGDNIDQLRGDASGNYFHAGGLSDRLYGRGGTDFLYGEAGADAFYGGTGADVMTGGDDAGRRDRYIYFNMVETGVGVGQRDIIMDFVSGEDRIELSRIDADITQGFKQRFTFVGDAGLSGTAGELAYTQTTYNTIIQGDVNGDGVADFEIQLVGVMDLTAGDFLI